MSSGLGKHRLEPHESSVPLDLDVGIKTEYFAVDVLKVTYVLEGALDVLDIGEASLGTRKDGLWKDTCFEAFFGFSESGEYLEYNFSPSGDYAIYRFDSYREGMQPALNLRAPEIYTRWPSDKVFHLIAFLNIAKLSRHMPLDCGLTAVIKTKQGDMSHWALAHPAGKPDFHNRDCFTLKLAPPNAV